MLLDHIALVVSDPRKSAEWYCKNYDAEMLYSDDTWSFIELENIKIAFVISKEHPRHIAFRVDQLDHTKVIKKHRDGSQSYYTKDLDGNIIEMIKYPEDISGKEKLGKE